MEEPWLRGPIEGVHPLLVPVLYSLRQAREDLGRHTDGLTASLIWKEMRGGAGVGFHLRHIAGSTDRLATYVEGLGLSERQMAALASEQGPGGAGRDELLAEIDRVFGRLEGIVRSLDPATLPDARFVGRKRLRVTVAGLLHHLAEHIQRHVGEVIVLARMTRE